MFIIYLNILMMLNNCYPIYVMVKIKANIWLLYGPLQMPKWPSSVTSLRDDLKTISYNNILGYIV